jgi:FtsH-binding integral membrane protein
MFGTNYNLPRLTYRTAAEINSAMGRVYGHMALAVITSMLISMFVSSSTSLMAFFFTGIMKWVVIFAPLVAVFAITYVLNSNPSKSLAQICLHGFAALMGLSFAGIFIVYNLGSIVSAFMGAAILFGLMSSYGYFTKKDLSGFGSFLMVGLIAVIIASIINLFIGNTLFHMVISAVSILVFLGLTAYDTQRIREEVSLETDGIAELKGALSLYLNFINIFLSMLQLFGNKDE